MDKAKKLPIADEILELPISYEEKGKEIGRKEGKLEGRKEGIFEGIFEGKREVALRMLRKGLSVDLIAEVTQLDKEEIQKLYNEL